MRDFILENLTNTEGLNIMLILLNNVVAMISAFFIMFCYKITYSGAAYSRKFNVSLGMICIVTTMVMCVISNNVALSLGMVGALSIIRFRTAIKDARDAVFIFWTLAVGIGCGVSQYALVGVGSAFCLLFMLLTKQVIPDNRHLLIIRGDLDMQNTIEGIVDDHFNVKGTFGRGAHQIVKSAAGGSFELVYGISGGTLKRATEKNAIDIVQRLMKTPGVQGANLVEQADDIGR